ncbi:FAD-dependent oxidoreductase [Ancylobacter amanitiformis]|uniref:D-amino-acid dehydrogenase n=1 Tax=Ancylobacter amanitiformis TaxID=217069 RepID=A0ABU0LXB4_9HYPH|nr:FAD-dependent oxidoreductase [Ancylobacter amanitiformis]MDQ0513240.1 D-amino-acid dehydrogenase [Ancylobacter amanitiformis]
MSRRRIAVIGAGVVGVSTAYGLARQGHDVILVDARAEPGRGASAGNAAQLSYAYGDAMASPALLRHLPAIALGRDPAFRVTWSLDPHFLIWGVRFLANAGSARWWSNTAHILDLAEVSRREMASLLAEVDLSFSYRMAGKLHLYASAAGLDAMRPTVQRKRERGLAQNLLSRAEATLIEPALEAFEGAVIGAVHTPQDAVGDCAEYCRGLTAHLVRHYGITTLFDHTVTGFARKGRRLHAVQFRDRDALPVDLAVVAAGPQALNLLRDLPEAQAIWPVRGYSLTLPAPAGTPSVSLTDVSRKLAFARIGDRFRVAGLADIAPRGGRFDEARCEALEKTARSVFPHLFNHTSEVCRWSGERPMTPSSRPLIGRSRLTAGLYYNIGHGMLGWTLALGTARRLVDMIAE